MAEPAPRPPGRVAVVAGASGLIGHELVAQLCGSPRYQAVTALLRRVPADLPPALRALAVDFDQLDGTAWGQVDDAFCALGTTIKAAGSRLAFRTVDYDYCVGFARAALAAGAQRLCIVTALGADPHSRVFYTRVKGEVEDAVRALPFAAVHIFRPSFLTGPRAQARPGERLMLGLMGPLGFLVPARYRPVAGRLVAQAMIAAALDSRAGVTVHESEQIR